MSSSDLGPALTVLGGLVLAVPSYVALGGVTIWLTGRFDFLSARGASAEFLPKRRFDLAWMAAWVLTNSHLALGDRSTSRAVKLARWCMALGFLGVCLFLAGTTSFRGWPPLK